MFSTSVTKLSIEAEGGSGKEEDSAIARAAARSHHTVYTGLHFFKLSFKLCCGACLCECTLHARTIHLANAPRYTHSPYTHLPTASRRHSRATRIVIAVRFRRHRKVRSSPSQMDSRCWCVSYRTHNCVVHVVAMVFVLDPDLCR